ncbi:MAG: flagellar FlbD family protein [Acidobacteriota bacterium]|nr:flagellar FlbD family protein [Acidobacteriota bacterium]
MIEITRLNGTPLVLNAELIKFVEQNPDTVITLVTGDKLVVREAAAEIVNRVLAYRRQLQRIEVLAPDAAGDPAPDNTGPAAAEEQRG